MFWPCLEFLMQLYTTTIRTFPQQYERKREALFMPLSLLENAPTKIKPEFT